MGLRHALAALGALAAGLTLTACAGDGDSASIGEDGCTPVVVATSSEKVNLMEELGKAFKKSRQHDDLDTCASVYAINVSSGQGATILGEDPDSWPLADRAYWPTIWSPASTIWTDRVAATGMSSLAKAKSFTRTPVVFGVPESMARALGYPKKPIGLKDVAKLVADPQGWASVGKPLWGSFKIAKTNPNTSTTGLSMILMQAYAASEKTDRLTAADVTAAASFSRTFESGAIHYGDTTGNVLKTLYGDASRGSGSAYVSAVAIEETSLFNYNHGNPDSHTVQPGEVLTPPSEKLVAVYPSGGSMWSDNPAVVLDSPWVSGAQRTAGTAFVKYLQTKAAQEILPKYGFRPLDPKADVSQYLNAKIGIDPAQPTITLPKPGPDVVSVAIDQWTDIRKPSAVLELVDISASMTTEIGGGKTRLDGAIDGARSTLAHFRRTDEIGVWTFTTGISSKYGQNIVPLREFAPLGTDLERLKDSMLDLRHAQMGGTPLYDAIARSYDYMLTQAQTGRINAIIVLSDGEDTDSAASLQSLLVKLNASAKEGATAAPVRIFTIAYGEDANAKILERIAKATGGQMFSASDPTRINQVFASVINNF